MSIGSIETIAILLDLDGTLYDGSTLIPGADETLRTIRAAGLAVRFVSNTTRMSRRALYETLLQRGLHLSIDELITAPVAAAAYLRDSGRRRILPLLPESTLEDLAEFDLVSDQADAVLVGDLGMKWNFETLNRAFRSLMEGAELVAVQKNRYWSDAGQLSLDAGPFVVALEYASGKESVVVGKPSRAFFQAAAKSMKAVLADTVMIGDDVYGDVEGAQKSGARGILVRTGKFREEELVRSGARPDAVIDSIADLPEILGLAREK